MAVIRSLSLNGEVRVHVNMSPWACPECGHVRFVIARAVPEVKAEGELVEFMRDQWKEWRRGPMRKRWNSLVGGVK